jgi:hypothetical protein
VTKRYHKRKHKFGIEVPKSWDDCVKLDKENDNTIWQDAVRKEMNNVRITFKILNGEESVPPTYQETCCHMIFDIKIEDLRRKASFVAGGHTTDTPHAVKLPQPQLRMRTYTQTGQSTLRATQVRAALSHAYAVTYQNTITDKP